MFSAKSIRLLIAACCAAVLVVFGISKFRPREDSAVPPLQSAHPVQPQAADLPAHFETAQTQTSDAKAQESGPRVEDSAGFPTIPTFRQWAETAAASGFANADDWNAYYESQQWRSYVGQTVEFQGVAVDSELAVQKITPALDKTKP